MPLTNTQNGILIASIAGASIIAILLVLFFLRGRVPFTFSPSEPPSTTTTHAPSIHPIRPKTKKLQRGILAQHQSDCPSELDGEYEKYGELYVPPDKKPTAVALDIMMRCLLATGLPGRTTANPGLSMVKDTRVDGGKGNDETFDAASVMENGHVVGPPK